MRTVIGYKDGVKIWSENFPGSAGHDKLGGSLLVPPGPKSPTPEERNRIRRMRAERERVRKKERDENNHPA